MSSFAKEFKEFISKGNVVSMAVGIIIGGSFTSIVNSVVDQIITPLLGMICGGVDFSGLAITVGEASFGYGIIISNIINFLLTALVLFWIVKGMNRLQAETEKLAVRTGLKKEETEETKEN